MSRLFRRIVRGAGLWGGGRGWPPVVAVVLLLLAAGGAATQGGPAPPPKATAAPSPVAIKGVENAFRLSPGLYSGGQPEGAEAFEALKKLGVTTVVSVDGTRPDVETARRFGIRYVHLPVGYDGIPRGQAVRLVKAVRGADGPVFVHCHHGKHRGPAAAALCGLAVEGWTVEQALNWLTQAGTSADYPGLFATVRGFAPPSAEEVRRVGDELPERADVPPTVEAMVRVDQTWDRLKEVQAAGFKTPKAHPDLDPPHEALLLAEGFREFARLDPPKDAGEDYRRMLSAAADRAAALREALLTFGKDPSPDAQAAAGTAFGAVGKSCTACHARFRDR